MKLHHLVGVAATTVLLLTSTALTSIAYAQSTKPALTTELNGDVYANGLGKISGANLHQYLLDLLGATCGIGQTSDCVLPPGVAATNGALPHVSNNASLKLAVGSASLPMMVRDSFANQGDGGEAVYGWSSSPCSLNAGAGDDGSQVKGPSSTCWLLLPPANGVDVTIFGVDMTGAAPPTTTTSEFNNAFNYGGRLTMRPGTININGAVTCTTLGTTLVGSGFNTIVNLTNATADGFVSNTSGCIYDSFRMTGAQTAGSMIHETDSAYVVVSRLYMYGWFTAINVGGAASAVGQRVKDCYLFSPQSTSSTGLLINTGAGYGSVDFVADNVLISGAGGPGVLINNGGDLHLNHVSVIGMTTGLKVAPTANQAIQYLDVGDSLFDSNTANGVLFYPTGSGAVIKQAKIHNSWVATSTSIGVLTQTAGGGLTQELQLVDDIISNNQSHGFLNNDSGTTGVHFVGGSLSSNNGYGIFFNTGSTKFSIDGTRVGPTGQFVVGNVSGGIALAGTNDYFNIQDLDVSGNSGTNFYLSGYAGSHGVIHHVLGYNPVGASALTAGASPWTYTSGPTSESISLTGGTVSSVTSFGQTKCTASPCSVELGPNESMIATYTVAPTVGRVLH